MIGSGENSGVVGFLVGVMMLVFAGIFFSLLADKRFSFSSGKLSLKAELDEQADELLTLRSRLDKSRSLWLEDHLPRTGQRELLERLRKESADLSSLISALDDRKRTLEESIRDTGDRLADYRGRYRRQVRMEAVGEDLGVFQTRTGKSFTGAVIRQVSGAGMVIRHDQGLARLSPSDLDNAWNERFQWSAEEAEAQRRDERNRMQAHLRSLERRPGISTTGRKPASRTGPARPAAPAGNQEKIESIRHELLMARARMHEAETRASNARMEAAGGRGRSVPGSLETWDQRANRLDASARKLRAQYIAARGKLAAISPRDPALNEVPRQ